MIQVFKDASGYPRWVAVTSTSYRDRDGEIVSSDALRKAVAYGDATGERGPLRFWHVPGLDIGTTDFQSVTDNGRFLVESGLITNSEMANALQEKGGDWQMSIGFNHPANQPDVEGVFKDISIFERSITPPNKAANPFTSFNIEGGRKMLTKEKLAALKELLGPDSIELTNMLTKVARTDKAAQDAGVAFKEEKVSNQEKHIAALEQRLLEMQQQLFELQGTDQGSSLKHWVSGSGKDGYSHGHKEGDPLDYGHDTSPDMMAINQGKINPPGMKAYGGQMGNPYEMKAQMGYGVNPYEMKGQMCNPYEMKGQMGAPMGSPMMNPYEMKGQMGAPMGSPMMNPYEMKGQMGAPMGSPMMNPYEMKAGEDMGGMGGMGGDMGGMGGDMGGGGGGASDMLLTAEEMTALADAVAERLMEKLSEINNKMTAVEKELEVRGFTRNKEISETTEALEKLVEHAEATQDEIDALRAMNEELLARTEQAEQELVSLKEFSGNQGSRTKSTEFSELQSKASLLEARLKELEGDQPRVAARPSQSGHNVVNSTTVKEFNKQDVPSNLQSAVEQSAYGWLWPDK
jgi:hypothetical protein